MDNTEDYAFDALPGLTAPERISAFSHPAFLRRQLVEQNASIGALPEGCHLVGFDLKGYSAYRDGLSSAALLALAEDVDVFTQELASRFGLLLTGRPAGDSATFIALPSFDEAAYRAFIEGSQIQGLLMRSAVQTVQKGTAFVHLFEGGALGLSGAAVVAYNAELNGMKHTAPIVAVSGDYPILDVDPAHVEAESLVESPVDEALESFGHAILKIHAPILGDPEAVQAYVRGLLEGPFRGAEVLEIQEGMILLKLARQTAFEFKSPAFLHVPFIASEAGVTCPFKSTRRGSFVFPVWVCEGMKGLKGKVTSFPDRILTVNTGFQTAEA